MHRLKSYLFTVLLALFVVGQFASSAVAHCDHALSATDGTQMEMTHHSSDMDTDHSTSGDSDASANCFECAGSPCHSQSLVPVGATNDLHQSQIDPIVEKDIDLKFIFLFRIPDPPKALS